nr:unnamed protein product [Callosobruchus chinensis]
MSSRSERTVDLALQMKKYTDRASSSEAFSSLDSDLDPTFVPSINEELSCSSDVSDAEELTEHRNKVSTNRRKQQTSVQKRSWSEQENEDFESQPCYSKSLLTLHFERVGVPNQEATYSLSVEPENYVSEKE